MQCIGVLHFPIIQYYGGNYYVTAVVYLACEYVVLDRGYVGAFILVSVVKRSLGACWL